MTQQLGRSGTLFAISEKPDESEAWLGALQGSLEVAMSATASGAWQFLHSDSVCGVVLHLIAPRTHALRLISTLRTHRALRGLPYYVLVGPEDLDPGWLRGPERVELLAEADAHATLPRRLVRDQREGSGICRISGRMPTHRLDQALQRTALRRPYGELHKAPGHSEGPLDTATRRAASGGERR